MTGVQTCALPISARHHRARPDDPDLRIGVERLDQSHEQVARTEDGVIVHGGAFVRLRFGARDPSQLALLQSFANACRASGVDGEVVADIKRESWEKFVFLVGLSAMTSVTRKPIGVIRADPQMRETLKEVMTETHAVGQAEGAGLPKDFVDNRMAFVDTLPEMMQASMLHDLQAGKPLELPWLSGAVVRLAQRHAIATPVNRTIVAALKPYVGGAPA